MNLREARLSDRPGILEIASRTWEGWDYVPLFLDQWLKEGGLYVAEIDGSIIGLTKTTELSPGELWFEGIRVRENERGRGLGLEIARKQLEFALAASPRMIRLSTADVNEVSRKVIKSIGFQEYAFFNYYENEEPIKTTAEIPEEIRLVNIQDEEEIEKTWSIIRDSEEYKKSRGLLPHTWKFSEWTLDLYRALVGGKKVYTKGDADALLVLLPNRYTPGSMELAFLEGGEKTVVSLIPFAIREVLDFPKGTSITGFAASDRKRKILEAVGMLKHPEIEQVYVFDYPLS